MSLYLLLLAVPVLGLIAFAVAGPRGGSGYSWVQFYAQGKDSGFSLRELELLRRIAVRAELEDPTALFWSVKHLDRCIAAILRKAKLTGEENAPDTQSFLSKLYTYRKKIEFEQPRYKKGIKGSRSISEAQKLKILVEGIGVYDASVLRNSERFITISRPTGPKLPAGFSWKGRRLAIYFWRRDDAGYVFDTYVLDDTDMRGTPILQLAHSDSLFRSQKRRSVRKTTRMAAYLYLPKTDEHPERLETESGLRCIVEDLSEDGIAVTIGGRAPVGLRVKIQFELSGEALAMSGVVRSVDWNEETNRSTLHVEALPLSLRARNVIQGEVFGVASTEAALFAFGLPVEDDVVPSEESEGLGEPDTLGGDASGDEPADVEGNGGTTE